MSAPEALKHRWIAEEVAGATDISQTVSDNLVKNFNAKRKLRVGDFVHISFDH